MPHFSLVLVLLQLSTLLVCYAAAREEASPPASTKPPWNETWPDKLKRHLLAHYDKYSRPAQHGNTTEVRLDVTFRHVELDELKAMMTIHSWVSMMWMDEKLRWDEKNWGGLSRLHVADHEIWQPDIVLYNSATGSMIDHYGHTHCLVYPNGQVLWVPPAEFVVFCNLDLRLWPFDSQMCWMRLGSWTYDGEQVDLQMRREEAEVQLMDTNMEWELAGVTHERNVQKYTCCDEPYIDITYNITVRRRSPTYSAIVITPATVIVLMTLSTFWLPADAGEKLLLNGCTAIVICMFLLYFSQRLPAMASNTPLVVLFYSSSLYLVCFSMIISVVVINLARSKHVVSLPWYLRNILSGWLGRVLGLSHLIAQAQSPSLQQGMLAAEELRDQQSGFDEHTDDRRHIIQTRSSTSQEWLLLASAIDRSFFLLYCLLFVIFAIVYAV